MQQGAFITFLMGVFIRSTRLLKLFARRLGEGRRSPIERATIDKYTEDIAVESKRIEKELGFIPQYDLETGWRETIQEMPR